MPSFAHYAVFYGVERVVTKQSLLSSLFPGRITSKLVLSLVLVAYPLLGLATHFTSSINSVNGCFRRIFGIRIGRSTRLVGCSHLCAELVVKSMKTAANFVIVINGI